MKANPTTYPKRQYARYLAALFCLITTLPGLALSQTLYEPNLEVKNLGNGRFSVGEILIDKQAGYFTVPATIIDLGVPEAPIEFLVVTKNGPKSYESLFAVDANAFEFNIACLLIGLDPANAVPPLGNFDPTPAAGDPVDLRISWGSDDKRHSETVSAFLQMSNSAAATDEWVYIGSYFYGPDETYAADLSGIFVGFVHDPESIIQHASGLGLESYGAVTYRPVPGVEPGMPLTLTVKRLTATEQ